MFKCFCEYRSGRLAVDVLFVVRGELIDSTYPQQNNLKMFTFNGNFTALLFSNARCIAYLVVVS